MNLIHWSYFLSIEQDVKDLSRYIEFNTDNLNCYSIEIARLLMAATQDIDVLMKQICYHHGNTSANEGGYRPFFLANFPKIVDIKVEIPQYPLEIVPFKNWSLGTQPWWTANNKVKHQRHTHFSSASLQNLLSSVAALLVTNLYFYSEVEHDLKVYPGSSFFIAYELIESVTPSSLGLIPNYKLP